MTPASPPEQELRDVLSQAAKLSKEERLRRIGEIRAMTLGEQRTPGVDPDQRRS